MKSRSPAVGATLFVLSAAISCSMPAGESGGSFCPAGRTCGIEQETVQFFEQDINYDLDILFVIDDSPSMEDERANLKRNLPVFMNVLKSLPGGLPDVHIGVISTSLGVVGGIGVPGCQPGGDGGR